MEKEKAIALLRDARKHREHAEKLERIAHRQLDDADHDEHGVTDMTDPFGVKSVLFSYTRNNDKTNTAFVGGGILEGRKNAILSALHYGAAYILSKGECNSTERQLKHACEGNKYGAVAYQILGGGYVLTYNAIRKAVEYFDRVNGHTTTIRAINKTVNSLEHDTCQ